MDTMDKILQAIEKLWAYPAALAKNIQILKQVESELETLRKEIKARYPDVFSE